MREFWVSSGHHLTRRTDSGDLAVTNELILAYLARPELLPPDGACAGERALHASLVENPRRLVAPEEIARIADRDSRENWNVMVCFRDRLLAADSIEAAYLDLVRRKIGDTPPLLLDQLVHLILRNALEGCNDPHMLRAAELFFRPQRVSLQEGMVLLADAEVVDAHAQNAHDSPLLEMFGEERVKELDVLSDDNAWTYWSRSDAFTMTLNIGSARARQALAEVIEIWVGHLLVDARVEPVSTIEDPDWRWFVGLDAEATRIGNALWQGQELDEETRTRVLALFRLTLRNERDAITSVAGRPIYLIFAMTGERAVRLKPQNLICGLPLTAAAQCKAREVPSWLRIISKSA